MVLLFACLNGWNAIAGEPGNERDNRETGAPVVLAKPGSDTPGIRNLQETKSNNYKRWSGLKYSGYIRSFNQYRVMPERYQGIDAEKQIVVNGVEMYGGTLQGYQEPLFLLRLEGNPTSKTFFKLEYALDNQMTGIVRDNSQAQSGTNLPYNRRATSYRVLQFEASANTDFGDFRLICGGGVLWYRVSPFTFWNYEYRDDMFERYPWEPEGYSFNRYNQFYATQNIARDSRWGNTATQGFILEARNLPFGFGGNIVYGKTDNSGGFQSFTTRTPRNLGAFRVDKAFGRHKFGINYFNQFGAIDSRDEFRIKQKILTLDGRVNFDNVRIYFEAGAGKFQDFIAQRDITTNLSEYMPNNPEVKNEERFFPKDTIAGLNWNWAPALMMQADISKDMFGLPLNIMLYRIEKSTVNINSQILNSANPHALATPTNIGSAYNVTTFHGVVTDIQQMTNNRQAAYLKHEDTYGKFKLMIGTGLGQELENLSNGISYQHRANAFTRSRFAFFTAGNGPYGRINNIFRRTFETIYITDTVVDYKKGYNSIDLSMKYKFSFLGRDLIVSNYNNFSSVQDKFSAIPVFDDKAFLRYFYEEFMAFYALTSKISLVGFVSHERAMGNMRTELADADGNRIMNDPLTQPKVNVNNEPVSYAVYRADGKPIDQRGMGYGIGVDYDFSGRAGLYLRHRWFNHRDVNFIHDKFHGQETAVELKIFF